MLLEFSQYAFSPETLKVAVPVGLGLATAAVAYMSSRTKNIPEGYDESIPVAPLRPGHRTHDKEYDEDWDAFLINNVKLLGPVFRVKLMGQDLVVMSGNMVREVFMNNSFSFADAMDDMTGMKPMFLGVMKSNWGNDGSYFHDLIRDQFSPSLQALSKRIYDQLVVAIDEELGVCNGTAVDSPIHILQVVVASALASVFMGHEFVKNKKVINSFIMATGDFISVTGVEARKKPLQAFLKLCEIAVSNPLLKHRKVLTDAATPVVIERRRREAEAAEKGIEYEQPLDLLQQFLNSADKYGFVDLEDICGQLLIIIMASVHTTTDGATAMLYYLAIFPECVEPLYQEQLEVLAQIKQEREELRQAQIRSGAVASAEDFIDTELDPKLDADLDTAATKRMVKMDSFIREFFRYRLPRVDHAHMSRGTVVLSNGMVIHNKEKVIPDIRSVHHTKEFQGDDDLGEFKPWRFIGKNKPANKVGIDLLPFGMGKHVCPGRYLAVHELKVIGALFVTKYSKFEMIEPKDRKKALFTKVGYPCASGLIFTSRVQPTSKKVE
ncbi:hypothetical protein BGX23_000220 [Mortierella sp. AD031]|nr:hypothetical protein BGX23_000220 [Mortierella sp. AD031]KAG0220123.1 hypothetical protein BGX33_008480 [Mortierella sp. NVP41]